MPVEVRMPQLGESIVEGTISKWLKQPGERVERNEALVEVLTDKVDSEVPAPQAGIIREIVVPAGATARVGEVLALLDSEGELVATAPHAVGEALERSRPWPPISPVVARLAQEYNIDLSLIVGTGADGRVRKKDILRYLETAENTASEGEQLVTELSTGSEVDVVPLSAMRRTIADHMERSVRTAPQVTTVMEADMSRVVAHLQATRPSFEQQGIRLTYTPYFVEAAAVALRRMPIVNSCFTSEGIAIQRHVHIGVAVALDEGLIVPVVRDADEKNLAGLARALGDLTGRARNGRLHPGETQGGTFTITNYGVSGSLVGTPIINQPQAAILGIGAIKKRPVVVEAEGIDAIAIRPLCYLSLTFDHRVLDGAVADRFLALVVRFLEHYGQAA